jgi:ribose transport system substrate-binding protein
MRRLARPIVAALAAAVSLGLAACSGGSSASAGPRNIGFVVPDAKLNFAAEMAAGYRTGVSAVPGVSAVVVGPNVIDNDKEVAMFRQLTSSAKAGISVFTLAPDLFASPMADAVHSGIPLIAVDNPPPVASPVTLFVGNDNFELGKLLADQAIAHLPANATGTVVLGTSAPGVPVLEQRAKGMAAELKAKLPGVTVLGPFDSKRDLAADLAAWRVLVRANPKALAFLGTGAADGWNLATIRRETHGKWLAGAYDLDPRSLAAVKSGDLLLVSPEHFVKGAIAGRLQADHAATGARLPKGWIYTPGLAITQANIDAIMARQASLQAKQAWFAPEIDRILTNLDDFLRPMSTIR